MRGYMGNNTWTQSVFVAVLAAAFSLAQTQGSKATLEQQLESEYILTTPTADITDIVTMGFVPILQKKRFSAGQFRTRSRPRITDKDGQIKFARRRGDRIS